MRQAARPRSNTFVGRLGREVILCARSQSGGDDNAESGCGDCAERRRLSAPRDPEATRAAVVARVLGGSGADLGRMAEVGWRAIALRAVGIACQLACGLGAGSSSRRPPSTARPTEAPAGRRSR